MHRIAVGMTMSSESALVSAATGLSGVDGVRVIRKPARGVRYIEVIISTDDPDDVDIAREIVWQLDPDAEQESLMVLEVVDDTAMVG